MKRIHFSLLFAAFLALLFFISAQAQDNGLVLSIRRDFGYASGGGDIQGLFSLTAGGPPNLISVTFYVDKISIAEVTQAPFKIQFNTDQYPLGQHQLYAIGITSDGKQLQSQYMAANFLSASESGQAGMKIVLPILAISLVAVLLSALIPLLTGRKTVALAAGAPRSYPLGGAICPKCARPFAVHIYGLNLLTHKLDRCPYCGKWSLVKLASPEKLRNAEQAELARTSEKAQISGMSAEEKQRKDLEDSKYRD